MACSVENELVPFNLDSHVQMQMKGFIDEMKVWEGQWNLEKDLI